MDKIKHRSKKPVRSDKPTDSRAISEKRRSLHRGQREATEGKLLTAAEAVFTEKGYGSTTVNDIIERCGVGRGTFYLYYEDKRAIFKTLVSDAVKDCYELAVPDRNLAIRDRIQQSTRMHLERFASHSGILRCLFEVTTVEPELGALHNQYRAEFVQRIERHLTRASEAGLCRDIDPKVASYCLGCMIGGVTYIWLCARFEPWDEHQQLEPIVNQITDFWCQTMYLNV